MEYQFKYTLDDKDYLEFNRFYMFSSLAIKRSLIFLRLIVPVLLIIMLVFSVARGEQWPQLLTQIFFYALATVLWLSLFKPLLMIGLKKSIKNLKLDGKLPYGKDVLLQFDEADFTQIIENKSETKTKYESIEKVVDGDKAVYIFISSIQAFILPFSLFEGKEQKSAFLEFINNKLNHEKEL